MNCFQLPLAQIFFEIINAHAQNSFRSQFFDENSPWNQALSEKHPLAQPLHEEMLLQGPIKLVDPIIFNEINADLIQKTAARISGAAGPSKLDAEQWQKKLCSKVYGSEGTDLCHSIATLGKQLATEIATDPESLTALLACKLIPLDKIRVYVL